MWGREWSSVPQGRGFGSLEYSRRPAPIGPAQVQPMAGVCENAEEIALYPLAMEPSEPLPKMGWSSWTTQQR